MNTSFFDWVKRLTLAAISSSPPLRQLLVLKGGNLLDFAFGLAIRASLDLDFSIEGELEPVEVREAFEKSVSAVFEPHGYAVIDVKLIEQPPLITDDLKPFWGGYNIAFKLVESSFVKRCGGDRESLRRSATVVGSTGSTVFRVDISKHEYVAEKQSYVVDGIEFLGYSVEMAVAEKLRAICQQMPAYRQLVHKHLAARARDFVDIHVLIEEFRINFSNPDFHATLTKVFAAKRVSLQLLGQISQHRDDHRSDFVAVAATIRPDVTLEDFDFYVDRVVRECEQLKPLWDEQTPA